MMLRGTFQLIAASLLVVGFGNAGAQDAPDDVAVWSVIEAQWEANEKGNVKWIEALLAEDFVGWDNDSPAPRNRASVRMWQRFQLKQWDGIAHELYPLSIVVHGDTAVAHYLYSNAGKTADGETQVIHGRFTDVLVRIEGDWKFISWHGGAD